MALETPNLGHTVSVNQVSAGNTDSQRAFRPYIDLGQTKTWANKGGMNALNFTTQSLFMQKGSEGVCFGLCKNRREDLGSRVGEGRDTSLSIYCLTTCIYLSPICSLKPQ